MLARPGMNEITTLRFRIKVGRADTVILDEESGHPAIRVLVALLLGFLLLAPSALIAASISACDVNANGTTDVDDVRIAFDQVLGLSPCTTGDVDDDGKCTLTDIDIVINAILSGTCSVTRAALSSVSCVPSSLPSGAISTCTATLSKAAGAGGVTISLSSSLPS